MQKHKISQNIKFDKMNSDPPHWDSFRSVLHPAGLFSHSGSSIIELIGFSLGWLRPWVSVCGVFLVWVGAGIESGVSFDFIKRLISEKRMAERLLPAHSVVLFDFETAQDKVFAFFRDARVETNLFGHDVVDQLQLIFRWPWSRSMK